MGVIIPDALNAQVLGLEPLAVAPLCILIGLRIDNVIHICLLSLLFPNNLYIRKRRL